MSDLIQKNIDQYLVNIKLTEEQKDIVLAAVTPMVYNRNQNVIKAGESNDEVKIKQHIESVKEYDQMIDDKIKEILLGNAEITYDF
jgi:hypothetical protein